MLLQFTTALTSQRNMHQCYHARQSEKSMSEITKRVSRVTFFCVYDSSCLFPADTVEEGRKSAIVAVCGENHQYSIKLKTCHFSHYARKEKKQAVKEKDNQW